LSDEVPTTPVVGTVYVRSTAHGSCGIAGETLKSSPRPERASVAVEPTGTAPGCQLTVALPSAVDTAPAAPATATAEPGTAAGTGAATTGAVVGAGADVEPPLPVAVTTGEIVAPMSSGVSVYDEVAAPRIATHCVPTAEQRRH